jgi:anti-anti-sigma regulatory factor
VRLLDASAVGVLLAAHNRARRVGVGFRVRGATGIPLQVLEITGVLGVLGGKS